MTCLQHPQLTLIPFALSEITTNLNMYNSSDDNQTNLFAPKLSELMGDPKMVTHLHDAFLEDLIGMMLIYNTYPTVSP